MSGLGTKRVDEMERVDESEQEAGL